MLARATPVELAPISRIRAEFRGHGDHSRLSCSAADTQLGAGFCRDLQQAFCTDVGYAAQSRQATHYLNHLVAAQQNRRQERNAGRAGAEKHDSVDCGSLTALLASFIERDTPWLNQRMFKPIGRDLACLRGSTPR
jgi:hypothetical protein